MRKNISFSFHSSLRTLTSEEFSLVTTICLRTTYWFSPTALKILVSLTSSTASITSVHMISQEDFRDFIAHYVLSFRIASSSSKKKHGIDVTRLASEETNEIYFKELIAGIGGEKDFEEEVFEILHKELPLAICLSHLYWELWSLYMSKDPNIEFDYIAFANECFEKYTTTIKLLS